jgi:hypothetical protein
VRRALGREAPKIVCLNIRHGGGRFGEPRWREIIAFIEAQDPNVIVLTEWQAAEPEKTRWAESLGMSWGLANDGKARNDGKPVNGVFVATKLAFKAKSKTPGKDSSGRSCKSNSNRGRCLLAIFPKPAPGTRTGLGPRRDI